MPVDINFMVGGEAGQGVQSAGYTLAKALARDGFLSKIGILILTAGFPLWK